MAALSPQSAVRQSVIDAIRLTLEAADNDRAAVEVIRVILADAPGPLWGDTTSVKRLLRAIKRHRTARLRATLAPRRV